MMATRSARSRCWAAVDAAEEPVHHLGALLEDRPELLPVYGLGDMAADVADKPCDLRGASPVPVGASGWRTTRWWSKKMLS
jgi:hypothetical protein